MSFEQDVDVDGVADGQPEGSPAPASNPLEPGGARFEQVYGKMKDYENQANQWKELGDPKTIREQLAKFQQYEKALTEYRTRQAQTPEDQDAAARSAKIRSELEKVYPEIKDVQSMKELRAAIDEIKNQNYEQRTAQVLDKASQRFTDVLKTNKIDTKHQSKIEEYIVSQMSEAERQDFIKGKFEIAERIFDNELKEGLFAGLRTAPRLPQPLMRNTPGGTPPSGNQKKITTLEEAADIGFPLLRNRE